MEALDLIIFWLLLIVAIGLLKIKKQSTAQKVSKSVNQESEKFVSIDRNCKICGQPIPKERLAILPDSVLCFPCKIYVEQNQNFSFPEAKKDYFDDCELNHLDPYLLNPSAKFDDEKNEDYTTGEMFDSEMFNSFNVGLEAYEQGNFIEARKWFQLSADMKNPSSEYYLGIIYENGQGINRDYQEATKWYWRASKSNITDAQINLGKMFQDGRGVKKNYAGALRWFNEALESCEEDEKSNILDLIVDIQNLQNDERSSFYVDLDSSVINSVEYDPHKEVLEIKFKQGAVYEYYNVPEYVFDELLSAESHGRYAHRNIFYSYRYKRIK